MLAATFHGFLRLSLKQPGRFLIDAVFTTPANSIVDIPFFRTAIRKLIPKAFSSGNLSL
jgi:hypothetical protein